MNGNVSAATNASRAIFIEGSPMTLRLSSLAASLWETARLSHVRDRMGDRPVAALLTIDRHPRPSQRLVLREDETPPESQRALRNQHRLQAFERGGKMRLLEEPCWMIGPWRDAQLPAPRQM